MPPAPALLETVVGLSSGVIRIDSAAVTPVAESARPAAQVSVATAASALEGPAGLIVAHRAQLAQIHNEFVAQQSAIHDQFLQMRQNALFALMGSSVSTGAPAAPVTALTPTGVARAVPAVPSSRVSLPPPAASPAPPTRADSATPAPASPRPVQKTVDLGPPPKGPSFGRAELEIDAGGKISEIFGPLFEQQDDYAVQVRMPMPPP